MNENETWSKCPKCGLAFRTAEMVADHVVDHEITARAIEALRADGTLDREAREERRHEWRVA